MKILHVSDLHGDDEAIDSLIRYCRDNSNLIDVLAITGDTAPDFLTLEEAKERYLLEMGLNNFLKSNALQLRHLGETPEEIFRTLRLSSALEEKVRVPLIRDYDKFVSLSEAMENNAKTFYLKLKEKTDAIEKGLVVAVLGDHDLDFFSKYLGNLNLHREKKKIFQNLTFAGYGDASPEMGSTETQILFPPHLRAGYNEQEFFMRMNHEDADIVLAHVPPFGILDTERDEKGNLIHTGSFGALAYILRNKPLLFLCGHQHDATGFFQDDVSCTVVSNPGNFGKTNENAGKKTAYLIEVEEDGVKDYKIIKIE